MAVFSALISFFIMHTTIGALIDITGIQLNEQLLGSELGIETMQIGVFGGILIGFLTAYLYNRFHKVELPDSISLFSGERLVPIVSSFGAILSAVILASRRLYPSDVGGGDGQPTDRLDMHLIGTACSCMQESDACLITNWT